MRRRTVAAVACLVLAGILFSSGAALAESKRIKGEGHFGCVDREVYEKLTGYAADKDEAAFRRGLQAALLSGECTMFRAGEEVYLVDTAIFHGFMQIRRKGETIAYWTGIGATE